jgi:hypothetical protein
VQVPKNSQNLNRYSYVLNNPLSLTDPSGYFIKELALFVAAVARVVYTWEDPSAWVYLAVSAKNLFNGMGSQQSGLPTGATAGAFANGFTTATSFNTSGVQHGAAQESRNPSEQVRAAIIGGTGSDQTGWKFSNGGDTETFWEIISLNSSGILRGALSETTFFIDETFGIEIGQGVLVVTTVGPLLEGAAGALDGDLKSVGLAAAGMVFGKAKTAVRTSKWVFGKYKSTTRWTNQMKKRGWSGNQINEAVQRGNRVPAKNLVNKGNPATSSLSGLATRHYDIEC